MPIQILGVGLIGTESGIDNVTTATNLPWLQDTDEAQMWSSWSVTERDVYVLDGQNRLVAVVNVTTNDLSIAQYRDEMRDLLLDTAASEAP